MLSLIRGILSYKFFPVCWTVFVIILLCLPGSLVPGNGIFSIPNLDKLVHVFLFGTNVMLWGWHFGPFVYSTAAMKKVILADVLLTIVLGIGLEYVQLYFIPNRSFSGGDIVADIIGAVLAGSWLWYRSLQRV